VVIGFSLPARDAVDEWYAQLTAAGYADRQPPFDAFWGARYPIVADPDDNDVGLMSPVEESRRTWPPQESRLCDPCAALRRRRRFRARRSWAGGAGSAQGMAGTGERVDVAAIAAAVMAEQQRRSRSAVHA